MMREPKVGDSIIVTFGEYTIEGTVTKVNSDGSEVMLDADGYANTEVRVDMTRADTIWFHKDVR